MGNQIDRRSFVKQFVQLTASVSVAGLTAQQSFAGVKRPLFKISLAEWSLHRALFAKQLDHLDFAKTAKNDYGITAVEYVNQFFKDKATDRSYLGEMKKRARDLGVESRLIMIDGEGALGDADESKRRQAIENHYKWVEAAKFLAAKSFGLMPRAAAAMKSSWRGPPTDCAD